MENNLNKKTIRIIPVSKPRMTRSDKWKKRKCVLEYRDFCDQLRLEVGKWGDPEIIGVNFFIPTPKSWSKKKTLSHCGLPHRQKPDIDNLLKAVFDALYEEDKAIHTILESNKTWVHNKDYAGITLTWIDNHEG